LKLRVSNLDILINNVIPHFNKYPLFTQKRVDFLLMCKIIELVQEKKHLTTEGLNEILSIKAAMNLGLSDKLKNEFLTVKSLTRLSVDTGIPNKD
jgi:LAGLIDADG endonuclease